MTTALVSLAKPEVPWSRPEHPLLIGKDILELLSSSMYVDPMCMYREYVQNSADAIDVARSEGLSDLAGTVQIRIDPDSRTVFIRDDGAGLSHSDFVHQLTALGGSRKRGTGFRGFRGVGRLAGLAFAQELIFRSRQDGEKMVHELRWDSREVRAMLRSTDLAQDLRDIVARSVQVREISGSGWPRRFFEVELKGVVRHKDDRLLNQNQVLNYLAQVAPVPFHSDFLFSDQIRSLLAAHGIVAGAINVEIVGLGNVYRPHRNTIASGKSGETKFQELTTIYTPGRDGATAAVTWVLHSDYRGALPSASLIDGWRFRVGDIQVGHNDLLMSLFPEARFNSWCVAETHVLDSRILPNGRRDHFEQNSFYLDLLNHLGPHARAIAQKCRDSSIERNLVRKVEHGLSECDQHIRVLGKGALAGGSADKLAAQLRQNLDQLQRLSERSAVPVNSQKDYQRQIKGLKRRLARVVENGNENLALEAFSPMQRSTLIEVFAVLYDAHDNVQNAQALVDKILSRLRKRLARKAKSA